MKKQQKQRVDLDLSEACNILLTILKLVPVDEQNAYTHAIEMLATQAGWLVDRSNIALGHAGVVGERFEDWEGVFMTRPS